MSWWFKRNPGLLASECEKIARNGNYKELFRCRDNILISHGEIIIRLRKTLKSPIVIIYPESTPYELPNVVLLKKRISDQRVLELSKKSSREAISMLKEEIKYYDYWHQNTDGTLCLLEQDNLETYGEFFNINSIINRTRDWLAGLQTGKLPPDSPEVEFFAHFRNRDFGIEVLIPESFSSTELYQGGFYCSIVSQVYQMNGELDRNIFLGIILNGYNRKGIMIDPIENRVGLKYMPEGIKNPIDLIKKRPIIQQAIDEKKILEGYWWHVDETIPPIQDIFGFAKVLGRGIEEKGFLRIKQIIGNTIIYLPEKMVLGLRFRNKRQEYQWQCFYLIKGSVKHHPIIYSENLEDYINVYRNYELKAIATTHYTENNYHLRNKGLANREELKSKSVAVIGCGALGGEVADILAKAGVGTLELCDNDRLEINNSVRHVLGIDKNGMPKVFGLAQHLLYHNFFINVNPHINNIFNTEIEKYYKDSAIGISTIANDNTEGYLNEQAIISNKVMFYARALRGGKIGRIFRVIPGQDACFHCLSLYADEKSELFIDIPPDPDLPTITNECNNPIRPASAAELKMISSIAARIVLDHIEKGRSDSNHWIWLTEPLEGIKQDIGNSFSLFPSNIPPHKNCPYCMSPENIDVTIESHVISIMREEIKGSKEIETGGILLGKIDNNSLQIKEASGPGDNAKRTPVSFLKDKEFCQKFIYEAHARNEDDSKYLGEWHYHPSPSNKPSSTDLTSLKNIATSSGYLTENPVMIIFSNDGDYSVTVHPINNKYYFTNLRINN